MTLNVLKSDKILNKQFPFKIFARHQPDFKEALVHAHDYFQICYVTKGSCLHWLNGRQAVLVKGDLLSVPPYQEHMLGAMNDKPVEIIYIDFLPYLFDGSPQDLSELKGCAPFTELNSRLLPKLNLAFETQQWIERILEDMMREWRGKRSGYELMIKSDLLKLLVAFGREYMANCEDSPDSRSVTLAQRQRHSLDAARQYIDDNYMHGIKLLDVARRAAMAPNYFSTLFKQLQGQSPIEYLNEVRIRKAMELLKQTDLSIEDIVRSVGFNHPSHFHRMFKRKTGVTPAEYRK